MAGKLSDTCKKKDCPLWRKHKDKCPNYLVMSWREEDNVQIYTTEDCSPVRICLMIQQMIPRFIGLQQASEQERNNSKKLIGTILKCWEDTGQPYTGIIDIEPQLKLEKGK